MLLFCISKFNRSGYTGLFRLLGEGSTSPPAETWLTVYRPIAHTTFRTVSGTQQMISLRFRLRTTRFITFPVLRKPIL